MIVQKQKVFAISALVVLSGLFLLSAAVYLLGGWDSDDVQQTLAAGNQIAESLERYREDNGMYPEALKSLVPNYLNGLPLPSVGNMKWDYVADKDGYYLGVNGKNRERDPVLYRTDNDGDWYMDTK